MARMSAPSPMAPRSAPAMDSLASGASGAALGSIGTLGAGSGALSPAPHRSFSEAFSGPAIAAGEWDDNANYREFLRYLADEEALPIHRVDLSDRRFLVVRDVAGKPVPRCRVTVTDQDQHQTTLTTMASGRAILFPHAEGLTGRALTATTACGAGA
jgi:hypothetical protein